MSETDRRSFLKSTLAIGAVAGLSAHAARQAAAQERPRPSGNSSVMNLVAPKLDTVRVGLIGVGERGMDHLMCWRIVDCLRNGEPLDQSVHDAAAWSVIGPISAESVADRGNSKPVPDFTRGVWRATEPLPVVGGSA